MCVREGGCFLYVHRCFCSGADGFVTYATIDAMFQDDKFKGLSTVKSKGFFCLLPERVGGAVYGDLPFSDAFLPCFT